jgi:hypothetical protein
MIRGVNPFTETIPNRGTIANCGAFDGRGSREVSKNLYPYPGKMEMQLEGA